MDKLTQYFIDRHENALRDTPDLLDMKARVPPVVIMFGNPRPASLFEKALSEAKGGSE